MKDKSLVVSTQSSLIIWNFEKSEPVVYSYSMMALPNVNGPELRYGRINDIVELRDINCKTSKGDPVVIEINIYDPNKFSYRLDN